MTLKDDLRDFMGGGRNKAPAPETIKDMEAHASGKREQQYKEAYEYERAKWQREERERERERQERFHNKGSDVK